MVRVSFIIPVYNAAATIEHTLDSVLAQRFRDFEVLMIDDGSVDETLSVIRRRAASDPRIRVLQNQENMGVSATRNRGLDVAAGEFIRFVDADDVIPAGSTAGMVRIAEQQHADMVVGIMRRQSVVRSYNYGRTIRVAEKKQFDKYDGDLIHSFSICNKLFRRDIIESHHVRFQAYKHAEDGLFLYDYLQYADRLCGYKKIAYVYNKAEFFEMSSATQRLSKEMLEGVLEIADRILAMHKQAPQRFRDDFRARILGTTLINEYYRQIWRMEADAVDLLLEQIGQYWKMLPDKQRREVIAQNKDLPSPDRLGGPEDICRHPVFTIAIGKGVSDEKLPVVLQSLYYQKMPCFEVFIHPAKAEQVPPAFRGQKNLTIAEEGKTLAAVVLKDGKGEYMQSLEEDIAFTYESLSRAYTALQKGNGAIRCDVLAVRNGQLEHVHAEKGDGGKGSSSSIIRLRGRRADGPAEKRKEVNCIFLDSTDRPQKRKHSFRDSLLVGQWLAYGSMIKRWVKRKLSS